MDATSLAALPPTLVADLVERLRAAGPEPLAVLVTGSYARGTATLDSDLDLMGLYRGQPVVGYRTWFVDRPGRPLHVSAGASTLDRWRRLDAEPADWSLGFPTEEAACYVWATDEARACLGEPPITRRPPGSPELEDFVESAMKAKRALAREDGIGVRWHASDMGMLAPRLLLPLNPERRVADRRDALAAALDLPVAPATYAADLAACLGLTCVADQVLVEVATRLPRDLLAFLRERLPNVDPQSGIAAYLADGTLERHLAAGE